MVSSSKARTRSADASVPRVSAPLEPYPADVSEWSALQFHTRVAALADSAIAVADAAPATPLADFSDCLEYSAEILSFGDSACIKNGSKMVRSTQKMVFVLFAIVETESGRCFIGPPLEYVYFWLMLRFRMIFRVCFEIE